MAAPDGCAVMAMTCRFCGVETGTGSSHRSQAECVRALTLEIEKARREVERRHSVVTVELVESGFGTSKRQRENQP